MEVGEMVKYKGYDITRQSEPDYVVEVAHDSLEDAKAWIDRLIDIGQLDEPD